MLALALAVAMAWVLFMKRALEVALKYEPWAFKKSICVWIMIFLECYFAGYWSTLIKCSAQAQACCLIGSYFYATSRTHGIVCASASAGIIPLSCV